MFGHRKCLDSSKSFVEELLVFFFSFFFRERQVFFMREPHMRPNKFRNSMRKLPSVLVLWEFGTCNHTQSCRVICQICTDSLLVCSCKQNMKCKGQLKSLTQMRPVFWWSLSCVSQKKALKEKKDVSTCAETLTRRFNPSNIKSIKRSRLKCIRD